MPKDVKTAKKGKARSLRESLAVLIFVCWVVPVLLTVIISSVLQARSSRYRVADVITSSVENTAQNLQKDLEGVINATLNISYIPTVRDAYTLYRENGNTSDLFNASTTFLTQQYSRNPLIKSVYLMFPEVPDPGETLYAYNPTICSYNEAHAFFGSTAQQKTSQLINTLGSDIGFVEDNGQLYVVRVLSLQGNLYKPYAVLVAQVHLDALFAGPKSLSWLTDMSIYLNGTGLTVTGEQIDPANYSTPSSKLQQINESSRTLLLYASENAGRFTFTYYVRADMSSLITEFGNSLIFIVALAVLAVPLMGIVVFFFVRKVNRPISTLSGLAKEIDEGKYGTQIDAEALGSQEFVYLGTQLNAMSARLKNQFERLYREELALRDARIKALQSQINPHFLGNTLEIINWEARLAGNVKVSAMMEALSTMLEAALDRRHRPLVHLSEEMMYVNAYLYIIGERLGKRLDVKQEIDNDLLDWYVPRLVLQPIVENAVEHGVTQRQRGEIIIRAVKVDESWMRLEVENDTPLQPADAERINKLLSSEADPNGESSGNIGIRNVHQRLQILYGPKSGLTVESRNGCTISSMLIGKATPPADAEEQESKEIPGNTA